MSDLQVRGPLFGGSGSPSPFTAGLSGAQRVADSHSRYMQAVLEGRVFLAANSATQALSVNSVTATGIVLTNPPGSGRNLVLLEVCIALASLPAGQCALILSGSNNPLVGAVTHTTPLTPRNAYLGSGPAATGLVDSAATLPAGGNTILRVVGAGTAATVAASTSFPPFIRDEVAGLLILAPGCFISLQALTTAITVVASMMWEEVPILA